MKGATVKPKIKMICRRDPVRVTTPTPTSLFSVCSDGGPSSTGWFSRRLGEGGHHSSPREKEDPSQGPPLCLISRNKGTESKE